MTKIHFTGEIRDIMKDALPHDTAVFNEPPNIGYTYIPSGHEKALHPNVMLVEGIRGAGKSFWWAVLQKPEYRKMIAYVLPKSRISEHSKISVGFGVTNQPHDFPDKYIITQLITRGADPRQIWRTVILRRVLTELQKNHSVQKSNWLDSVQWVTDNPEDVGKYFKEMDDDLSNKQNYHLILFDALDSVSDDWGTMAAMIGGLLRVMLEFRANNYLRLKVFLRPDHIENAKNNFPDASKILNDKVALYWSKTELYGLLWQYLGNEKEKGNTFRDQCNRVIPDSWSMFDDVWIPSPELRNQEDIQKTIFHAVTGSKMGKDMRRGVPYYWLPNHLGDTLGQVSPRSFLAALRCAAEDNPRSGFEFPIFYESIKKGVQQASKIRVREMGEDYPWMEDLMSPLRGLNVPCTVNDIKTRWNDQNTIQALTDKNKDAPVKLPPENLENGFDGVMEMLKSLGIFYVASDNRIQMPDVYRVGYGLGRRGGVRAAAS